MSSIRRRQAASPPSTSVPLPLRAVIHNIQKRKKAAGPEICSNSRRYAAYQRSWGQAGQAARYRPLTSSALLLRTMAVSSVPPPENTTNRRPLPSGAARLDSHVHVLRATSLECCCCCIRSRSVGQCMKLGGPWRRTPRRRAACAIFGGNNTKHARRGASNPSECLRHPLLLSHHAGTCAGRV